MLTVFGSLAVGIMLLAYWREGSSKWMVLIFAGVTVLSLCAIAEFPMTIAQRMIRAVLFMGGSSIDD